MPHKNPYIQSRIERFQSHATRQPLFNAVEKHLDGRALVTLFTSFEHYGVQLEDTEADMLQTVLHQLDLSKGLALMINSPGGDGMAAERIVRTCRALSGTGDFWAIVPGKAKSAGTLICMGASKILMSPSSELGPVDPQITRIENGAKKTFSAHGLVTGYDKLFTAANRTKGRIEPYIQQLNHYDARDINKYRSYLKLSEDMAIKLLSSGMMKGKTQTEIKRLIKVFLVPDAGTHSHGRPIYSPEALLCKLSVESIGPQTEMWKHIYELYIRTQLYVNSANAAKAIESREEAFHTSAPDYED